MNGNWIPSVGTRKYLYGIATAIVPLLVVVGTVTPDIASHILNIAAAVFAVGGLSLARANVRNPTDENDYNNDMTYYDGEYDQ